MNVKNFSLSKDELLAFKRALTFFYVSELRELALKLALSEKGNKMALIVRILHFLESGEKLATPKLPESSRAKRGESYPLHPDTLMVKGAYKNDLKTRLFFKELIGDHFHFTAFGIDWLNDRWIEGKAPTYQEFAKMWQEEYERRKKMPAAPKEEWAYINFVQNYLKALPHASQSGVNSAWEEERQRQKAYVASRLDYTPDLK